MIISETHKIFVAEDFTEEEKEQKNVLCEAFAAGHKICKQCGDHDDQLVSICRASDKYRSLCPRDKMSEDKLRLFGTKLANERYRENRPVQLQLKFNQEKD